ncbi:L,D-transpeptidase-like protein [Mangrovibacterium marinum]|uniref:L,D-transpeptidase-like protein n=2 Tax=Mangrovibacterium marinum TaxID=1639118 RepID=A0A2T5BZX2_9BACT|nr:L,D-transpeptidase-like protein [Mangrovibacterium marinum]
MDMRRGILFFTLFSIVFIGILILPPMSENRQDRLAAAANADSLFVQYSALKLNNRLPYPVFARAVKGLDQFHFNNKKVLTIIDYSRPSTEKRLFVLDLSQNKVLFESLVAHGKNSGMDYATQFSNKPQSLKSSPGFYATAETYQGKHGYSLRLDGLEKGVNDHARQRAIVMHSAAYVSEQFIQSTGRLGRSWGCPALPDKLNKDIIDCIKNGTCLYIYTNATTA